MRAIVPSGRIRPLAGASLLRVSLFRTRALRDLVRASALAFLLVAGCLSGGPSTAPVEELVPFRTLLVSSSQPVIEDGYMGPLTLDGWNATWARYAEGLSPTPVHPLVDAENETIVALALGAFTSTCHDLRIVSVTRENGAESFAIGYEEYHGEGPGYACGGSLTWPTHVIAIRSRSYGHPVLVRAYGPEDVWPHARWEGPSAERLVVRTLERGSFSGIHDDTSLMVRNASAWEVLWMAHRASEPAPAVDFAREMVAAVVVHGPTGCGALRLGNVTHDPSLPRTEVEVVLEDPGPEVQCLVAFQDVFEFAAIPSREGDASFVQVVERR